VSSSSVPRTASSWLRARAGRRVARPNLPANAGGEEPTHVGVVSAGVRTRREPQPTRPQTFADVLRSFNAGRHWRT
jgi:hypothetical protein